MNIDEHSKLYDHCYAWQLAKKEVAIYSEMIVRAVADKLVEVKEISGQDLRPTICINQFGDLAYSWTPFRDAYPTVSSKMGYTYRIDRDFGRMHVYEPLEHWQQLAKFMADFAHAKDNINEVLYKYLNLGNPDADI